MDSCKSFLIRDLLGDLINRQNDNGNSIYYNISDLIKWLTRFISSGKNAIESFRASLFVK